MGRGQELLEAARGGDKKTVEKILAQITKRSGPFTSLRRGPGVNVQDDKNGYTPLHNACMHGHKEIVRLLLAADASPCIVASKGVTPLHLAAWKGGSEIVAMLLAHTTNPVNVDQLTSDHETALLIAAQYKGRTDVISQLLEHGADVSICNSNDESALDLAARLGRIETVQLLIQTRPSLIDPYKPRACRGRIFPSTPLHLASKHDHKDVVIALLEAGVDPNIQTSTGTPLHEAACFSRVSVVRTLLARGANLYAKDKKGKTVYDLLSSYSDEATRVVRSVLREFEERSRNNLYESEDDLPPFPVQDCSPIYGMKTPETQNVTNKKESLISPSSLPLANNGPQSFVKKLASKYLGIKAKFSSTPNISNDSTSDVKSNHNSTGKSNFFRILPKKEVYGEVVCNNEFDTISLDRDRMVPLSRDTVVNRSNRSCPGFKISLQNIYENNEHDELSEIQDLGTSSESNVVELNEAINHVANNNNIFEPREKGDSTSILSNFSQESHNECYEPYELNKENNESAKTHNSLASTINIPQPTPRSAPNINIDLGNDSPNNVKLNTNIVSSLPTPAVRTHIPSKRTLNPVEEVAIYENVSLSNVKPDPPKRTVIPSPAILNYSDSESSSSNLSRSSTLSSASMEDESNLEDILLSKKSKSFRLIETSKINDFRMKADLSRTESNASAISQCTEVSAMENVDCSGDKDQNMILSMTGTLPNKKNNSPVKKKVLFRHKTFTNIEIDRRSTNVRDLPTWNSSFLKETLSRYHIRGTGHCIYKAPTIQEFMNLFNSESLYNKDNLNSVSRNSKFETAICFCKPKYSKHYKSAEDLLNMTDFETDEKVFIDEEALNKRRELNMTSFRCFCESENCVLHDIKRESQNDLVVKFSAISKSISTPDITLNNSLPTRVFCRKKSTPNILEEPYAVVSVEQIIKRNKANEEVKIDCPSTPSNISMTTPSTLSSTFERPYSIKDIEEISLSNSSTSTNASLNCASNPQLPLTKSSSEYSGHWTLYTCNSNVTIKSDVSYKSCFEEQADSSDDTLHSDEEVSDTDTLKSDTSDTKRPWVHSSSFRFGSKDAKSDDVIAEETNVSPDLDSSSKFESGIGSENSLDESGDGVEADVLGALLERGGLSGGVRSGSGRRRWDEAEATSEGDALSVSSAASSCAPLYLAHHHDYNKVSPTPPKKPPRRNLSVSPTHANSPSSGYSYELRPHARSQDDLDDIQGAKHYLKHGRSVDQYVDGKLSYSEYEENHSSPRIVPVANPRPSLKNRAQPVAITAVYENVSIKEQNPKRKLKRISSNATQYENYEPRMTENRIRKNSNQTRSSSESLLDSQSINSPSDCERYYDSHRIIVPRSPTHYDQPPTPDHPPPTPRQAENSIHERIRPLSQEYKRRSILRDSQTETEVVLLRAASAASVASGATDRSGNTDNCVEEYVCDVPFAGLFKGSTTTLDGIGLRPMPAERPKTLRKLKSVYDASPTEPPVNTITSVSSNGQAPERNLNGSDDEVRRRSNTTSSTHSGDKSLSILSPFDEQEEWAKISEIMATFGSKLRGSVFVSELEQEFTNILGLSCTEASLSPSVGSTLGLWLAGLGLQDYEPLFMESGFDDIDFINGVLEEADLKEMGIEENDRQKILESAKQLPLKIAEISNNNNNISKSQNESVDEWLRNINLEVYSHTFKRHLYVDMDRVRRIWDLELTAVLEIQKSGHRKRILASVSSEQNTDVGHVEDISTDLKNLKNNIQHLKEEIKEKLPFENLKAVPPPVVPTLAPPGGETLKRSKKNRPAPQPPRPSDLEIRAPSELLVGVPGSLKTQWKHQPFVLVTGAVTYVANYLGSTVVKELRGTESTKKSIQKLKKTSTKESRDSPDIILSISYRGVKFLNTITRELICEHEIRNIHCACQDADDLTHFAYITKDHTTKSHYCHVFRVATMDQATEVILTLGEAFEVAYQMALREQSNRTRVTQSLAKTPTHDPTTMTNKEKPNVNHGRSHSITEIKLNGHQLKIAPIPASLSNEDFQSISRNSDGSRSPRTPLLKAPIASTEEL